MSRKIVIIPTFASAHFLKCWIPNVIDSIDPDIIIMNEGLFPSGPENKGHIDDNFRKKYCYNGTLLGFDIIDTEVDIRRYHKLYSNKIIYRQKNGYGVHDANLCFLEAITRCDLTQFKLGDWIFPLEPDAFHLENDKEKIQSLISKLEPGQGIQTRWVDFLETQYYTEAINVVQPKYRRFCYRFDNMENYRKAMTGFMTQNYSMLTKTDEFITYHYPWFCPGKYKRLRFDLIYRSDPKYWEDFQDGLDQIRYRSEVYHKTKEIPEFAMKTVIRPSRQDEGRYAQFIDIEHPDAIKAHPNFVK